MKKFSELERKDLLINGVYRITNIKTNKFYIGSSSSNTYIYTRLKHHYGDLKSNKHINKYLQNSWNKYGEDNFYCDILEICSPEECLIKEQYWINLLNPVYNHCKIAGSSLGITPSQETKDKISKSNKLWYKTIEGIQFKEKLSQLRKNTSGYKHTEEHKKYMSLLYKGRKFSEDTLTKMRKPKPNKKKKVIDLKTNIIYNTIEEAAENFNIRKEYICALCRGKRHSKKYNFKYLING